MTDLKVVVHDLHRKLNDNATAYNALEGRREEHAFAAVQGSAAAIAAIAEIDAESTISINERSTLAAALREAEERLRAEVEAAEAATLAERRNLAGGHALAALQASKDADAAAVALGEALRRRDVALRAVRANSPDFNTAVGNRPSHRELVDRALAEAGVNAFCSLMPMRGEKLAFVTAKLLGSLLNKKEKLK